MAELHALKVDRDLHTKDAGASWIRYGSRQHTDLGGIQRISQQLL
jgi:hypothetical protein